MKKIGLSEKEEEVNVKHEELLLELTKNSRNEFNKGLFINDVIIFGGYRDPPLPLR